MAGGLEFITEIRIAQFWRKLLGEMEYVSYNPDDLRRWYDAMELRGPEDIRGYMIERNGRYPMGQVTGIVGIAPHPPRALVQIWLESHDKLHTGRYWLSAAAFLLFVYEFATNLQGCTYMRQMNSFQLRPPQIGGHLPTRVNPMGPPSSTSPQTLPKPAASAAKPTGPQPRQ
jgi:hypothetical protein